MENHFYLQKVLKKEKKLIKINILSVFPFSIT